MNSDAYYTLSAQLPPTFTFFPYTTLFRSPVLLPGGGDRLEPGAGLEDPGGEHPRGPVGHGVPAPHQLRHDAEGRVDVAGSQRPVHVDRRHAARVRGPAPAAAASPPRRVTPAADHREWGMERRGEGVGTEERPARPSRRAPAARPSPRKETHGRPPPQPP